MKYTCLCYWNDDGARFYNVDSEGGAKEVLLK